jgi:hypothetical protein
MSWAAEIKVTGFFATKEEAVEAITQLSNADTGAVTRIYESAEPVTYKMVDGDLFVIDEKV